MMVMPVPTVPVMAMMPAMPMMPVVVMPVHLGGGLPGIILYRAGGARIDQRYRTRTLNRIGRDEECASRHQAQNFRSVHGLSPRHFRISRPRRAADLFDFPRRDAANT